MSFLALRLLLARVPRIVWEALVVVLLLVAGFFYAEHRGAQRERVRVIEQKLVHDSVLVVRLDTVVLRDTIRLARLIQHYDTTRLAMNIHDTIEVKRFVAIADSTVLACKETVAAFALSCAAKDTLITDLRHRLALGGLAASPPVSWKAKAAWFVGGALAGGLAQHVKR